MSNGFVISCGRGCGIGQLKQNLFLNMEYCGNDRYLTEILLL